MAVSTTLSNTAFKALIGFVIALLYLPLAMPGAAQTGGTSILHFPANREVWQTSTDEFEITNAGGEAWFFDMNEIGLQDPCSGQYFKFIRQFLILDWMIGGGPEIGIPWQDMDGDGYEGDGFDAQIFGDSLYLLVNGAQGPALAPRAAVYRYAQVLRFPYPSPPANISGKVFEDLNLDCAMSGSEPVLEGWIVKALGQPSGVIFTDTTDADGYFALGVCVNDTSAELSLDLPYNYGGSCPLVYQIPYPPNGQTVVQNIPVQLQQNCRQLSVDMSTAEIQPCATGNYSVSYCNVSNTPAQNAKVTLALDNYLGLLSASMPFVPLGGNAYEFSIGDLPAGFCGDIKIQYSTDCNTPQGATHCSEVHISPVDACNWNGPWLEAEAVCDGDSVRLRIRNIGNSPMSESQEFVIIEDLIMYMNGTPFQLDPDELLEIAVPADGSTYYIQTPQVNGHPFGGIVTAQIEGCGGLNLPGASLVLPLGTGNPFQATDCLTSAENTDAIYKTALPLGYGPEHLIEKNTDIEYTVHFQNTHSDTVKTIVVYVALPTELSAETTIPGASSHDYDFDILYGNILRFRFDNIRLVDSSTNFSGAKGFVSYRISQEPDLADGKLIKNTAQVHFDNFPGVQTAYVTHRIGSSFIKIATEEPGDGKNLLKTFPNPGSTEVYFDLQTNTSGGRFTLRDALGLPVSEQDFSGALFRFERGELPAGIYLFSIQTAEGDTVSGKIEIF